MLPRADKQPTMFAPDYSESSYLLYYGKYYVKDKWRLQQVGEYRSILKLLPFWGLLGLLLSLSNIETRVFVTDAKMQVRLNSSLLSFILKAFCEVHARISICDFL